VRQSLHYLREPVVEAPGGPRHEFLVPRLAVLLEHAREGGRGHRIGVHRADDQIMGIRIAQFLLPVVDDPQIVSFPFREYLLESRFDLLVQIVEQAGGMLSGETDLVSGEHSVGADDHPNARDQSGRLGLVVRIPHADHSAVTEVVAVADRDGPEEPVSSVGEQATRVLDPVASLGDLILQLHRLQGSVKMEQLKRKVAAIYGERERTLRGVRYVIYLLNSLGIVSAPEKKGFYQAGKFNLISKELAAFAVKAIICSLDKNDGMGRSELETHSFFFAFDGQK
jgi:hypothetical protein